MSVLYCQVFSSEEQNDGSLTAPLDTATCLFLLSYLSSSSSSCPSLSVKTVLSPSSSRPRPVHIARPPPHTLLSSSQCLPPPASLCTLPVLLLNDGLSCVSGLSAVLRQIVKEWGEEVRHLLGFRESCLAAPAHISPWVWFCEVELTGGDHMKVLQRLQAHLSAPVRSHNINKFQKEMREGRFAEGPHFLLTDIVLALAVNLILGHEEESILADLPLIRTWYERVRLEKGLAEELSGYRPGGASWGDKFVGTQGCGSGEGSLYKRDPTRYKPRHKIYTQQAEIEECFEKVSQIEMMGMSPSPPLPLPSPLPQIDVPSSRQHRKLQQVENLVSAALLMCRTGDVVVDFCSGSGHVGLSVAALLPSCRLVLLDNKEGSLERARTRAAALQLKNVWFIRSNLGYFVGDFQVGIALHACGVASDLVLQKCLEKRANLVICPCCYGSIQTNHDVKYPQSSEFREAGLSERGYIVLGHCADQAGTAQGERAMLAVDTDRCLAAKESGYSVSLTKIHPPSCSTRNNLIIATTSA